MSINGSETGQSGSSTTNSTQNGTSVQTPNNLPFLQAGWNAAQSTLAPVTSSLPNLASAGAQSSGAAIAPATTTAQTGANAADLISSGANGPNGANQYLTPIANGSQVNNSNPEYNNMVQQLSNSLQPQIDGPMAAAGRYGSGANANAFASALTNQAGQLGYQNFAQQQQNQLSAAGQLSANNANSTNQQVQAAGLTPSLTSNLFTPGTASTTAAFSPILDYMTANSLGNPGGTTVSSGTGTSNTNGSQNGSSFGAGVKV